MPYHIPNYTESYNPISWSPLTSLGQLKIKLTASPLIQSLDPHSQGQLKVKLTPQAYNPASWSPLTRTAQDKTNPQALQSVFLIPTHKDSSR